ETVRDLLELGVARHQFPESRRVCLQLKLARRSGLLLREQGGRGKQANDRNREFHWYPSTDVRALKFMLSFMAAAPALLPQPASCEVSHPTASFSIPHSKNSPELNTDPKSATWKKAKSAWIVKDCSRTLDYPDLKTEVKAFWTDTDLYMLFISPY